MYIYILPKKLDYILVRYDMTYGKLQFTNPVAQSQLREKESERFYPNL